MSLQKKIISDTVPGMREESPGSGGIPFFQWTSNELNPGNGIMFLVNNAGDVGHTKCDNSGIPVEQEHLNRRALMALN